MTPSTASIVTNHLDDLFQRTASCLGEAQNVDVAALLAEFSDVFACSADAPARLKNVTKDLFYKLRRC